MRSGQPASIAMRCIGFLVLGLGLGAEIMPADEGFLIDPPQGYVLSQAANGRYELRDGNGMANLSIVCYQAERYPSAKAIAESLKTRLAARVKAKEFGLYGRDASCGEIEFSLSGQAVRGYYLAVNGQGQEPDYLLLSYVSAEAFKPYDDTLYSALDSFSIDAARLGYPGPLSLAASPLTPGEALSIGFSGAEVEVFIDPNAERAEQDLVEREYRVLCLYAKSPDWQAAWSRYYRLIYRDAFVRLNQASMALGREVELAWMANLGSSPAPRAGLAPPEAYVKAALTHVQGFTYLRSERGADFVNPLSALIRAEGDCDSRALLMAILLNHWNVKAGMAVSGSYSHALGLVGIEAKPGLGISMKLRGEPYLVAETTSKGRQAGEIAQSQSDLSKWLAVELDYRWLLH